MNPIRTHILRAPTTGLLLLACAALTGCNTTAAKKKPAAGATANAPASNRYIVLAESTPFFKLGPAQGSGADLELKKDTIVKLVKRGFGYSTVELESGQSGMVATQDIKPAPPEVVSPAVTSVKPSPLLSTPGQPNSAIIKQYSIDDTGNPVLPLAPLPEPEDNPKFRY